MDKIEFEIEKRKENEGEYEVVQILINGKNLIEILKEYELPYAKKEGYPDMAGGYDGIRVKYNDIIITWTSELYNNLNDKGHKWTDGKVPVLGCICGEVGCWPFLVRIKCGENKIIWTDFEQPYRDRDDHNFWDYKDLDDFVFDREQYEDALKKLKLLIESNTEKN